MNVGSHYSHTPTDPSQTLRKYQNVLHIFPDVWPVDDLVTDEAEFHVILVGADGFLVVQVCNLAQENCVVGVMAIAFARNAEQMYYSYLFGLDRRQSYADAALGCRQLLEVWRFPHGVPVAPKVVIANLNTSCMVVVAT